MNDTMKDSLVADIESVSIKKNRMKVVLDCEVSERSIRLLAQRVEQALLLATPDLELPLQQRNGRLVAEVDNGD
jgi:hypothetical protein